MGDMLRLTPRGPVMHRLDGTLSPRGPTILGFEEGPTFEVIQNSGGIYIYRWFYPDTWGDGSYTWSGTTYTWEGAGTSEFTGEVAQSTSLAEDPVKDVVLPTVASDSFSVTDASILSYGLNPAETVSISETLVSDVSASISEAFTVSDAVENLLIQNLLVNESITLSDSLVKDIGLNLLFESEIPLRETSRGISKSVNGLIISNRGVTLIGNESTTFSTEWLTVSDEFFGTTAQDYYENPNESLSVSDSVSKDIGKAASDSFSVADAAPSKSIGKSAADTITVSDAKALSLDKPASDAFSVSDSASKAVDKPESDSFSVSDAATLGLSTSSQESVSIADAFERDWQAEAALGDAISLTDALTNEIVMEMADAFSVADAYSQAWSAEVSPSETLSFSESLEKSVDIPGIAEAFSVGDSFDRSVEYNLSPSESLGMGEARQADVDSVQSDAFSLADSLANYPSINLSDAFDLFDEIDVPAFYVVDPEEAFSLTDAAPVFDASIYLTDSVGLSDSASYSMDYNLADSFSATDALAFDWTRETFSESFGISDDMVTYPSLGISDAFAISDSQYAEVDKQVSDAFAIADALNFDAQLAASESVSVADSIAKYPSLAIPSDAFALSDSVSGSFGKNESEYVTLSDVAALDVSLSASDSFSVTDALSSDAAYIRLFDDSFVIVDNADLAFGINLSDSISLTDQLTDYVMAKGIGETLTVADVLAKALDKPTIAAESFSTTDVLSKTPNLIKSDAFSVSDVFSGWTFGKKPSETISLSDVVSKAMSKEIAQSFALTDSENNTIGKAGFDSFVLSEAFDKVPGIGHIQPLSLVDAYEFDLAYQLADTLSVSDQLDLIIDITFSETLAVVDYAHFLDLPVEESINFLEVLGKDWTRESFPSQDFTISDSILNSLGFFENPNENFAVGDSLSRSFTKSLNDAISFGDGFAVDGNQEYNLNPNEAFSITDSLSLNTVKIIDQTIDISEGQHNWLNKYASKAIVSSLNARSDEITTADFANMLNSSSESGFTDFERFVPGDYEYRYALVRTKVAGTTSPSFTYMKLEIDVPDKVLSGTVSVPVEGVFVNFSSAFNAVPNVTGSIVSGTEFAAVRITGISDAGFTVHLLNDSNNPVSGTIYWKALGY